MIPKREILLNFLLKRQGVLVKFEGIFREGWGRDFLGTLGERQNLRTQLTLTRRALKGRFPEGDRHLATVRGYDSIVLCQGKEGDLIPLFGLYEYRFLRELVKERLRPIMEKGTLGKDCRFVVAQFSPVEAIILLRLARMPDGVCPLEELESFLENFAFKSGGSTKSPEYIIFRLRKKIQGSGLEIFSHYGKGYSLSI